MARAAGAVTIDMHDEWVYERLLDLTGGIGPDVCIDAVGMEAHGFTTLETIYDKVKTNLFMETERPHVVRQAIECCRKGGTVSIPGVYGGVADKIPLGALMNKALTIKTGQTHVHRYVPELLDHIRQRRIDPSFVVTHRLPLSQAAARLQDFPGEAGRVHQGGARPGGVSACRKAPAQTHRALRGPLGVPLIRLRNS